MEFVKNVYTAKVRNSFAPVFFLSFASNINDLGYNWEILIILALAILLGEIFPNDKFHLCVWIKNHI